jgi:hypothetical protein
VSGLRRLREQDPERAALVFAQAAISALGDADVRARSGRHTAKERPQAVLELLASKATQDALTRQRDVHTSARQ